MKQHHSTQQICWSFVNTHRLLLAGLSVFGMGVAASIWWIENYASTWIVLNAEAALQFIGGNWPSQANDHTTVAFAFGPTFRLILLFGAIRGAWAALTNLKDVLRIQTMKVDQILTILDRSIETRVLQVLEGHMQQEYRDQIHEAIKLGHEDFWNKYLPILMKDDEAAARRLHERFLAADL